ncbi:MAG: nicotinate phosphoribosyltransferase [Bacillota bacterium]|jgi:nicotinate phosphoribosyltransferase
MKQKRNDTMLCDYYELTMANGYFKHGWKDKITYFDVFFRRIPDRGGFAIAAGLDQIIDYIENLRFDDEDIDYLRKKGIFDEDFLTYLKSFSFHGDIWAIPEGTPIFPNEPILTVRAPAPEAQLIETFVLLTLNHQSLIATKANRVCRAADGRPVTEFGSRRAQGGDGAILGARAACIGGCVGTACTIAEQLYGTVAGGTMAHSWVQMFDSELEAFRAYCESYPNNPCLLVDTYNVLKSGIPNAIRVFDEMNIEDCAIRIDSGDITYLTKKARKMLDDAGHEKCRIVISNSLDEYIITDLLRQGAKIDAFGVGERLITAKSDPVFGGVYKLCAIEDETGAVVPKIKVSENAEKITTPHFKKVWRVYDKVTGKAHADLITVYDEVIDTTKPLTIFDPNHPWKKLTFDDYEIAELMVPVFRGGQCVMERRPDVAEIREYSRRQIDRLWDEMKRFEHPHLYYVDLSQKLWDIKQKLITDNFGEFQND